LLGGDSLENLKPRFIGQRLGDLFNSRAFHKLIYQTRWDSTGFQNNRTPAPETMQRNS
jgi:hypothetical protein